MEASELRIGNWVYVDEGEARTTEMVLGTYKHGKQCVATEDTFDYYGIHRLHPIPLTEEILLKAGFVYISKLKGGKVYQYDIYNYMLGFNEFEIGGECYDCGGCSVKVDYLHQLQNLYFALTGEELEIEL